MEEAGTPKSNRYWRLNEIGGVKMMLEFAYPQTAETPEEYNGIIKLQQRLEELQAEENLLVKRFERINALTSPKTIDLKPAKKTFSESNDLVRDYDECDIPF